MKEFDDLVAQVTMTEGAEASAVVEIQGLVQLVKDAVAGGASPQDIIALTDRLHSSAAILAAAVVANIMNLASPNSAILSAVIFNALIIVCLIPLALKGVKYRPLGAAILLQRNLLVYGLGGVIAPFLGIKLIDLILVGMHLA